mgnify:CR=1 FL=1
MRSKSEIEQHIIKSLAEIEVFLKEDNGGAEFVRFEDNCGVAVIRFTGDCLTCPLSKMTLRGGIERWLKKNVAEITRVEAAI